MKIPPIPLNENERLKELSELKILDTLPERDYDAITAMAAEICDVPISLISLIDKDRQWFKSLLGLDFSQTPREQAFCAHAINDPQNIFEIKNARKDERFHDNPLVAKKGGIVFYAGVPLVTQDGNALGTLCVIDKKPKELTEKQRTALRTLAMGVVKFLELRKKSILVEKQNDNLKRKNDLLSGFAQVVSHDLKSPLNNIIGLANLLNESDFTSKELPRKFGGLILESAENLKTLIDDVLDYAKSEIHPKDTHENVSIKTVIQDCLSHYKEHTSINFILEDEYPAIKGHRAAWKQILYNLISNAVKYNDKELTEIEISASIKEKNFVLCVSDNGTGIPLDQVRRIFEPLVTLSKKTRNGESSTGLGLASLKKLVEAMQGEIEVLANQPFGSIFSISVPFHEPTDKDSMLQQGSIGVII
ncbi:MAG: GAF domain-containing sensor histidine kinase [Cryomorphaceae bacterium]